MNNQNLVSVIVPTFKRVNMLGRAIESILSQTYKNIEIIIVDDNSEGDQFRRETELFMQKFSSDNRVKYIKHERNLGASEARNTGITHAMGDYITFLDDDDIYLNTKIEKQVYALEASSHVNLGFVYCGMNYVNSTGILYKLNIYQKYNNILFEEQMKRGVIGTPMLMVPKNVFSKIGGFQSLKYGQDYELVLRILANNYQVECVQEELINVYLHDEKRITDIKLDYFDYLLKIKTPYLLHFKSYTQRKILLHHYYYVYRHYCSHQRKRNALKYLLNMWKQTVLDMKLFYAPLFLLISEEQWNKFKKSLNNPERKG